MSTNAAESPRPLRLAVCVSGQGSTLQNLVDRIEQGDLDAQIVLVVASRAGIGAIPRAEQARLPIHVLCRDQMRCARPSEEALFDPIRDADADLVVLAGFLALVPVPEDYRGRIINVHPSLIPAFAGQGAYGMRVHEAVLMRGVKLTGCTVHFVDAAYDNGPIIIQRAVEVLDNDDAPTLAHRVFLAESEALPEAIRLYAQRRLRIEGRRVRILPETSSSR